MSAAQRRDAALTRIGSVRRWVITAAAGLSAGFAALVYSLAPGHSLSSARAATADRGATPTTQSGEPALPAPASAAALGVGSSVGGSSSGQSSSSAPSAPAPAPSAPAASAPAPSSPPVTSGGS